MVDFHLSRHVDAARGLVEDDHPRIPRQPLAHDHLLLVAAGEVRRVHVHRRGFDLQILDRAFAHGVFLAVANHAQTVAQKVQVGKRDVVADAQLGAQAVLLAVLGSQHHALTDRVRRAVNEDLLAVQENLAGLLGVDAEDGAGGFGAPGAHQARKAHDFPLIERKADVAHHAAGIEVFDLEDLFALFAGHAGEFLLDLAAHHMGDDLVDGGVGEVHGGDVLAVAHDGHAIHDMLQFLQTVGDVDDAMVRGAQVPDDAEEILDLARGERGGGLIHDEDARVHGKRLGDLHHLLLGDGQIAHHRAGGDVDLEPAQHFGGLCLHLALAEHHAAHLLTAQEHVFCHGEVAAHVELLVDDGHACGLRLLGGEVAIRLALDFHVAAVAGVDAAQDLHQRGFARAVLAQKRHDLAASQLEIHMVQRLHAGKRLADIVHGYDDVVHWPSPFV